MLTLREPVPVLWSEQARVLLPGWGDCRSVPPSCVSKPDGVVPLGQLVAGVNIPAGRSDQQASDRHADGHLEVGVLSSYILPQGDMR